MEAAAEAVRRAGRTRAQRSSKAGAQVGEGRGELLGGEAEGDAAVNERVDGVEARQRRIADACLVVMARE